MIFWAWFGTIWKKWFDEQSIFFSFLVFPIDFGRSRKWPDPSSMIKTFEICNLYVSTRWYNKLWKFQIFLSATCTVAVTRLRRRLEIWVTCPELGWPGVKNFHWKVLKSFPNTYTKNGIPTWNLLTAKISRRYSNTLPSWLKKISFVKYVANFVY